MPNESPQCSGSGSPLHSKDFTIGSYDEGDTFIKNRPIKLHNVQVRACGCRTYPRLGPLIDMLLANPWKTEAMWDEQKQEWI
jgi:hypothetical protein